MRPKSVIRSVARWTIRGATLGAAAYATFAGVSWYRYGRVELPRRKEDSDPLLDQFMPAYEAAERHQVRVNAPADMVFAVARELDLQRSPIIRAIFNTRELVLGGVQNESEVPRPLLAMAKATGWVVLAEVPGREVVVGTVTQPWLAKVAFRPISAGEFADFHETGYVKIVWTLRADPAGANESVARTETRVITTDSGARQKFRRYWALFLPGILLIRRISLKMVKEEAERRRRIS
jgi:hypothetical protein